MPHHFTCLPHLILPNSDLSQEELFKALILWTDGMLKALTNTWIYTFWGAF
jgi:hypothetical protein